MTNTILITGGDGQVSSALKQVACPANLNLYFVNKKQFDITNPQQVQLVLDKIKPAMIINTAAYTAVDKAETERELAYKVNVIGTEILARCANSYGIPLLHLSTDYVFDGTKHSAYLETDVVNPINYYGLTKLQGEQAIQANLFQHLILRVSGVFGLQGSNFVKTILKLAQQREALNIVADQFTNPTAASHIAQVLMTLSSAILNGQTNWGIYHYCDLATMSWYQFACEFCRLAPYHDKLAKLNPIKTSDYPLPAKRPRHSVLNCEKIKNDFKVEQQLLNQPLAGLIQTVNFINLRESK